jgi:uncharacterized protein (TIGR02246 family)
MLWGTCVFAFVVANEAPLFAQKAPPPAKSVPLKADDAETTIRETAKAYVDAFNKGDAKTVAGLWAEDGDYVDETGKGVSGRDAIQKKYAAFFAENSGAKIEVAVDAVHQVSPDAAIEDGHSKLTLAEQGAAPSSGRYTVVHARRNGKWLIASARDLPADSAGKSDPLQDMDWLIGSWRAERLGVEMEIDCRWLAGKSFVEATYFRREGDKTTPTATQIIGVDPRSGRLMSWMFNVDRGYAHGLWIPHDAGWAIEYQGVGADGTLSTAVNVLSRVNDALVWKSTNRTVAGKPAPDIEEVVLKRK